MIHLLTAMDAAYLERGKPYVDSLMQNCNVPILIFGIDCIPYGGFVPDQFRLDSSKFRAYDGKHATGIIQAGQFLDQWQCEADDTIVFTDADMVLQRPFTEEEMNWLEALDKPSVGTNAGPHETLADEAKRLFPHDLAQLHQHFPGYGTMPVYNTGVLAMKRRNYEILFERYVLHYPKLFQNFSYFAAVQWLICYLLEDVEPMPFSFHAHGHYGLDPGVTRKNGLTYFNGELVALSHHMT